MIICNTLNITEIKENKNNIKTKDFFNLQNTKCRQILRIIEIQSSSGLSSIFLDKQLEITQFNTLSISISPCLSLYSGAK